MNIKAEIIAYPVKDEHGVHQEYRLQVLMNDEIKYVEELGRKHPDEIDYSFPQ